MLKNQCCQNCTVLMIRNLILVQASERFMNNSNTSSRFLEKTGYPNERQTCSFIFRLPGILSLGNKCWNGGINSSEKYFFHVSTRIKREYLNDLRKEKEQTFLLLTQGLHHYTWYDHFSSQLLLLYCQRKTSQSWASSFSLQISRLLKVKPTVLFRNLTIQTIKARFYFYSVETHYL